jgi:5-formyltetrahydrofolate cyclo-ligase
MDKSYFRKKYKNLRADLSDSEIDEMSLAIANESLQLNIWGHMNYHIFLSIEGKSEVETSYLLHILQGKDKTIGVSKADFTDGSLKHFLLQENTKFQLSTYGIPEPQDGIELAPSVFDVVFIPVLAYDKKGNRVGYGKGFYDRFLAQCKPSCLFIGLSFFKPEITVPFNKQDMPLSMVITPSNTYYFNDSKTLS